MYSIRVVDVNGTTRAFIGLDFYTREQAMYFVDGIKMTVPDWMFSAFDYYILDENNEVVEIV